MKALVLFAGSRSVEKVAEAMGMHTFSVDIKAFDGVDLVKDIESIEREDIPFTPDIIWASPPCTTYSLAAISHHRDGIRPKTPFAEKSDRLLNKTLEVFSWFPDAKFGMENPVGMMGKMPQVRHLPKATVTYCSYGDIRMKPTNIWSNNLWSIFNPDGWMPREKCFNGNSNCHHEPAPRGSRTGTQGLKGAYERSRIPYELVKEFLEACVPSYAVNLTEMAWGEMV